MADAHRHAGAVAVAQAELDVTPEIFGVNGIFFLDVLTQRADVLLNNFRVEMFDFFHRIGPLSSLFAWDPYARSGSKDCFSSLALYRIFNDFARRIS